MAKTDSLRHLSAFVFPLMAAFIVSAGAVYVGMVFVCRGVVQNERYVCVCCVHIIFYAPTCNADRIVAPPGQSLFVTVASAAPRTAAAAPCGFKGLNRGGEVRYGVRHGVQYLYIGFVGLGYASDRCGCALR